MLVAKCDAMNQEFYAQKANFSQKVSDQCQMFLQDRWDLL
jgi:hypothetical protein